MRVKNTNKFMKKAFTLAEILIVLGIIGVVAALTIPTLMNNVQKHEYVVGLKKAYTEGNNALKLMANDYGCAGDLRCTGLFSPNVSDSNAYLGDVFVKYFKVVKNCRTAVSYTDCFPPAYSNYDSTGYKQIQSGYDFITADGMSFKVQNFVTNEGACSKYGSGYHQASTGKTGNMEQTCGTFTVDVNGLKGPNTYGRDVFLFFITNGKGPLLYPAGGIDDSYYSSGGDYWRYHCNDAYFLHDKIGSYCTGRVMEEGWQMTY